MIIVEEATPIVLALCRRFEGLRLKPYLCPAGKATVGYGATFYADGRQVQLTDPMISVAQAERLLALSLERVYFPATLRLCPKLNDPSRLAAITDFVFNLGPGRLQASTLRKRVNAEDWPGARAELAKWVIGGGKELPGLVKRRACEAALL